MFIRDHYLVQLLAWVLLHFAWQGVFILLSSRAFDFALRRSPASFRYRVFCLHLIALGIAPLLTLLISHRAVASGVPLASGSSVVLGVASPGLSALLFPPSHLLARALPYVLVCWTVGILLGAALVLGGIARCSRLRCVCWERGGLPEVIEELTRRLRIRVPPIVFEADVDSPFVVGVRQPRLVLPRKIEQRLAPEELRAILAHELAHVKRRDYRSNLLQTTLALLLWPHPAAWMIWVQLRHEREASCDEAAVQICGSALPLARGLYRLAVKARPLYAALSLAAGPVEQRVRRLLDGKQPSAPVVSWVPPAFAMVALAVTTSLLAQALPSDTATRNALIVSPFGPTIVVQAHDPAGSFRMQLRGGRVLGMSIENESIPPERVIQQGDSVQVLGPSGQELLAVHVDPRGRISWRPRAAQPRSTF